MGCRMWIEARQICQIFDQHNMSGYGKQKYTIKRKYKSNLKFECCKLGFYRIEEGVRKARWKKSIYSWFLFDLILGIYGLLRAFLTPSSMCWSKIWQVWRVIDPKVGRLYEETLDFSPIPMKYGSTCGLLWMCTSIHPCIQFWVKAHPWGKSISRPLS